MDAFRSTLLSTGLLGQRGWTRDPAWWLALVAGYAISVAVNSLLLGTGSDDVADLLLLSLSVVVWQPFWEELAFRGIALGQVRRMAWARRSVLGLTLGNLVVATVFGAMHALHYPPLLALGIVIPGLVFGFFRERYNSIYPGFLLHAAYNAGYVMVAAG